MSRHKRHYLLTGGERLQSDGDATATAANDSGRRVPPAAASGIPSTAPTAGHATAEPRPRRRPDANALRPPDRPHPGQGDQPRDASASGRLRTASSGRSDDAARWRRPPGQLSAVQRRQQPRPPYAVCAQPAAGRDRGPAEAAERKREHTESGDGPASDSSDASNSRPIDTRPAHDARPSATAATAAVCAAAHAATATTSSNAPATTVSAATAISPAAAANANAARLHAPTADATTAAHATTATTTADDAAVSRWWGRRRRSRCPLRRSRQRGRLWTKGTRVGSLYRPEGRSKRPVLPEGTERLAKVHRVERRLAHLHPERQLNRREHDGQQRAAGGWLQRSAAAAATTECRQRRLHGRRGCLRGCSSACASGSGSSQGRDHSDIQDGPGGSPRSAASQAGRRRAPQRRGHIQSDLDHGRRRSQSPAKHERLAEPEPQRRRRCQRASCHRGRRRAAIGHLQSCRPGSSGSRARRSCPSHADCRTGSNAGEFRTGTNPGKWGGRDNVIGSSPFHPQSSADLDHNNSTHVNDDSLSGTGTK